MLHLTSLPSTVNNVLKRIVWYMVQSVWFSPQGVVQTNPKFTEKLKNPPQVQFQFYMSMLSDWSSDMNYYTDMALPNTLRVCSANTTCQKPAYKNTIEWSSNFCGNHQNCVAPIHSPDDLIPKSSTSSDGIHSRRPSMSPAKIACHCRHTKTESP